MIVWVDNFQALKLQAVFSSFFMRVMILYVVVLGVVGGGWAQYKIEYEDN